MSESTEQSPPPSATETVASVRSRWGSLPPIAQFLIPVAAGVVVIAIVLAVAFSLGRPNRFEAALETCDLDDLAIFLLGDDGNTLILDMAGEEDIGLLSYDDVDCVLSALDTPSSVRVLMGSTRALDGRQSAEWDGIEASWSYHPDNGLDVLLTQ